MKIHADLSSEDPKQLCKDNKSNKDETSMEKPKDPHSDETLDLYINKCEIISCKY